MRLSMTSPREGPPTAMADPTLRYVLAARPVYERLTQVLTQLAGFSLLALIEADGGGYHDAPIALARAKFREAAADLRALAVPAAAAHHNHHLATAAAALEAALGDAEALLRLGRSAPPSATRHLREATDNLRAAGRLLPGFEMVDLGQACCAAHVAAALPAGVEAFPAGDPVLRDLGALDLGGRAPLVCR